MKKIQSQNRPDFHSQKSNIFNVGVKKRSLWVDDFPPVL